MGNVLGYANNRKRGHLPLVRVYYRGPFMTTKYAGWHNHFTGAAPLMGDSLGCVYKKKLRHLCGSTKVGTQRLLKVFVHLYTVHTLQMLGIKK